MADKRRIHVTPRQDGKWEARAEGADRAAAVVDRQADAIKRGREIARGEGGQLLVHGRDGRIREERTYRKDPPRTRG
jgi:uncharacterized protein YdaT